VRGLLVVSEVALAVMLLIGSGLLLKSFLRLMDVNPGFNADNLLTMTVALQFVRYQDPAKQVAYFDQALQQIRSLPGVVAAGACTSLPPRNIQQATGIEIEGRPNDNRRPPPTAIYMPATPGFLEALGVPLLGGRNISDRDSSSSPGVVVINQTLATQFFPNEDPLSHRLTINGVSRNIVGVVGDVKYEGLGTPVRPQVYVPFAQSPFPGMRLVVRTSTEPKSVAAAAQARIQAIDKEEGATQVATMNELISESVAQPRFNAFLIGLFAALAFILASIGIYGVISYDVTQRTSEIGIRMALGAQAPDIVRLVLRQGVLLTLGGLLLGIVGASALTRFLASLLFEVHPTDAATYAIVSALLAIVAFAASWIPTRRATRVDPLIALRHE
jgi:putative ABC transport system permease protein